MEEELITPSSVLVIDIDGRLTYMGQDGRRRIIIGNSELLQRTKEIYKGCLEDNCEGGCCI